MHDEKASTHRPPRAAILLIPVIAALVLTLFAWPNARLGPRDLPLGVAGSPRANALAASVLPLVLAGIVTGLVSAAITRRRLERAALVVAGSVLAGRDSSCSARVARRGR
jgi:hypothetical protein